jgi:hypothetical protein
VVVLDEEVLVGVPGTFLAETLNRDAGPRIGPLGQKGLVSEHRGWGAAVLFAPAAPVASIVGRLERARSDYLPAAGRVEYRKEMRLEASVVRTAAGRSAVVVRTCQPPKKIDALAAVASTAGWFAASWPLVEEALWVAAGRVDWPWVECRTAGRPSGGFASAAVGLERVC